jgi:hypothetical protein
MKNKEDEKQLNISRKPSTSSNLEANDEIANEVGNINSSTGTSLSGNTREFMESGFGYDFSKVRIHTDEMAARSADSLNALAYTVGNNVLFGEGQYQPNTVEGKRLLAHELVHIVQQGEAPIRMNSPLQFSSPSDAAREAADPITMSMFQGSHSSSITVSKVSKQILQRLSDINQVLSTAGTPKEGVALEEEKESSEDIEALDLHPTAKAAAYELKKKRPTIVFTSGRRNVTEQALAMAGNIVSSGNRNWMKDTYTDSAPLLELQKWVNDNPSKTRKDDISTALETAMNAMTDAERGKISKHLTGEAFDVKPVTKDADAIKKDIESLTGKTKFLDKEGGLVRWHVQF